MATAAPARLLTAEEFCELKEPAHGGKMELIRGEVVIHMPVGGPHGSIALDIGGELRTFVAAHGLGRAGVEVGFRLARNPDVVRAPDVHFVRAEGLADRRSLPPGFFPGPPDLAVEIVSPEDTDREVAEKLGQYLRADTLRVWIVRPEARTLTVHRPDGSARVYGAGDILTSDDAGFAVPGFRLALTEIFA